MKTIRIAIGFGILLMMCSIAASAQNVQADYDRSFNLAKLKTYNFYQQTRKPNDPLAASPINDRRIHDALDSQLKAHGLTDSKGGQPDFFIAYFVTTQQGLDIQDNRMGYFWRSGSINVNQVTEGTIVVIFVDSVTQKEVWRGFVSGTINAKKLDKDVNKGIEKLVKQFAKNQAGKN